MIVATRPTTAVNSQPRHASVDAAPLTPLQPLPERDGAAVAADPVLCGHCGRTASNGLVCIGMCVADSGY
jgi:hypothetical protein